jgi:hypothetical protein
MRHLINLYVGTWEWLEDRRGKSDALRLRGYAVTQSVWTFLLQGAAGGAVGFSLLLAHYLNGGQPQSEFVLFGLLFLAPGAVLGAFVSALVWLLSVSAKRHFNIVVRATVILGVSTLLAHAFSLFNPTVRETWSLFQMVVKFAVFSLPLVLLVGSRIQPGRLIILGVEQPNKTYNFGDWIAYPVGAVLRMASIVGLIEAGLFLASWLSPSPPEWVSDPNIGDLSAIAMIYFFLSSFFSIATPRKILVVPTAILVNLPLLVLVASLNEFTSEGSRYLVSALVWQAWMWVIYTVGRLIAPEGGPRVVESTEKKYGVVKKALPRKDCTVAL